MSAFSIGSLEVSRVEDAYGPFFPRDFLVGVPSEAYDREASWLAPDHMDLGSGMLKLSAHSWVIRTKHHNILIDTCIGNHKSRPIPAFDRIETPYLAKLAAVGLTPADIDFVMCTHLHLDHVGWNTRLENGIWVPTFPKARYLFGKQEFEETKAFAFSSDPHGVDVVYNDSILPVEESGQMELVEPGYILDDSVSFEAAPGHTPGHLAVRASDQGETGVFLGDVIHHCIQCMYPDSHTMHCMDPATAAVTRRRYLNESADEGHLLVPAHFGAPFFGRAKREGEIFRFLPGKD